MADLATYRHDCIPPVWSGLGHVRFTPKAGHWNSAVECPLCAKSGHSFDIEGAHQCSPEDLENDCGRPSKQQHPVNRAPLDCWIGNKANSRPMRYP